MKPISLISALLCLAACATVPPQTSKSPNARSERHDLVVEDAEIRPDGGATWFVGGDAVLTVLLKNKGDKDHMRYPGVKLTTSNPAIEIANPIVTFYGIGAGGTMEANFTIGATAAALPGSVAFVASVHELHCEERSTCPTKGALKFDIPLTQKR